MENKLFVLVIGRKQVENILILIENTQFIEILCK